jgi:hypothetical protein
VCFHPARGLATVDVEEVLATVDALVGRLLRRRGCGGRRRPAAPAELGPHLTIVVSAIGLLDFPVGTALGIYGLWVMSTAQSAELLDPASPRPI